MTAQVSDLISFNEEEALPLLSEPLGPYLHQTGKRFQSYSTACIRGYRASWSIQQDRLYLTDLTNQFPASGFTQSGPNQSQPITLQAVFPHQLPPIAATWFSGTLRVGRGPILEYIRADYGSVYEWEDYLEVEQGQVISSHRLSGIEVLLKRAKQTTRCAVENGIFAIFIAIVAVGLAAVAFSGLPLPMYPLVFMRLASLALGAIAILLFWASWVIFFDARRNVKDYQNQLHQVQSNR